ncbi:VanZ family protein [Psychromonas sp.]|nr:VanZ family protein [Psychromonas sp.]
MSRLLQLVRDYWVIISIILFVVIASLSLTPLPKMPSVPGTDKIHHFIAYGVLVLPLMLKQPRYWFIVFIAYAVLSGAIELIQPQVNRYGEWLDMLANTGGLICGAAIAYFINRFYPAR